MARSTFTYTIHQEDDHYWAEVDQLPGCFVTGDTPGELVEAVNEAISLWLSPDDFTVPGPDGG